MSVASTTVANPQRAGLWYSQSPNRWGFNNMGLALTRAAIVAGAYPCACSSNGPTPICSNNGPTPVGSFSVARMEP